MAARGRWLARLIRKKTFTEEDLHKSELRRCLSTFDLIGLGTASTLGTGTYILTGQIAQESAGPAVVLSYVIGGITAALAAVCYAEFAARVPRAGSAYVYSYVTMGELMAFVIGWNIILEYLISVAATARALSASVDYLTDYSLQRAFQHYMPLSAPGLSAYPDFLSFALVIVATGIVAVGVRESTTINIVLSCISMVVLTLIIICGFVKADFHNWNLSGDELPASGAGNGGFAPFGFSGVMAGAATCFFAYVGFDFIVTMGEEAEDSRESIPLSMGVTLVIIMTLNCGVATVVPLMVPYFAIDVQAPIVFAFDWVGWRDFRYLITLGALCAMTSSLTAPLFPMARVVYAMSSDGLIFRCLSTVSPRFRTPFLGTILSGSIAGVLALIFELSDLIHMLSIGTLLAFVLVAVCVIILRYRKEDAVENSCGPLEKAHRTSSFKIIHLVRPCSDSPTEGSTQIVNISIAVLCVSEMALAIIVIRWSNHLLALSTCTVVGATIVSATIIASVFIISRQPQNPLHLRFKVPFVPVLPAASCLINFYLMLNLRAITMLRFTVCMFIGFCVYFSYGFRNSSLNASTGERTPLCASEEKKARASTVTLHTEQATPNEPTHGRDSEPDISSLFHNRDLSPPNEPTHGRDSEPDISSLFHNRDLSPPNEPTHGRDSEPDISSLFHNRDLSPPNEPTHGRDSEPGVSSLFHNRDVSPPNEPTRSRYAEPAVSSQ